MKLTFVLALVILVSGLSTVYFGFQFQALQTGGTTHPFEWYYYREELLLSYRVFLFSAGWAVGWIIHDVLFRKRQVQKE